MDEKRNQTKVFDQKDFNPKRSTFDLSYPNKSTFNFNKIYPILAKKTMPGDSWHIKTSVFSRWLSMVAPTFSEYSIKFLSAFVANNMIYGGWQQFIGQGDDQSAQYLLPADQANINGRALPYITTKDIAKYFFLKMFSFHGTVGDVCVKPFARQFIRMFVAPIVSHRATAYSGMLTTSDYQDSACFDYDNFEIIPTLIVGSVKDARFWDDMVENNYVFEVTEMDGIDLNINAKLRAWLTDSQGASRSFDWAFHCYGANIDLAISKLGISPAPAFIELPKSVFFPIRGVDYATNASNRIVHTSLTQAQVESYQVTRYLPHYGSIMVTSTGAVQMLPHAQSVNGFIPYGYAYDLLPSELYTNSSSTTLSYLDVFIRTIGQHIVCQLFGDGTLSDMIGQNKEQHLYRQPFSVANQIFGNIDVISRSYNSMQHPTATLETTKGTYNEKSGKFSVGVVNDTPISLLPYLAYHKIWSDRMRDNRYELRCIYSDPYKSPFMLPLQELVTSNAVQGLYASGNCYDTIQFDSTLNENGYFPSYWRSGNDGYWLTDQTYSHDRDFHLKPERPFSFQSLVMLLSLRERRVVHDFFTMVTPTSQYGNEAVANLDPLGNGVSTLAMRMASRLQKFLERSNFVGSDFVKQTLAHFGVKPEHCNHCSIRYLGGKVMKPTVSPVTMTSSDNSDTNQVTGQQTAQMYCSGNLGKVSFSCNEHGYVFQLATIQNDFYTVDGAMVDPINYFDYPLPEFADLGPEALPLQRVVQTDGTPTIEGTQNHPLSVFGYIPRYGQWKCSLAEIHGDFRDTLSYWVTKRQLNPDLLHGSFGYGKRGNIPQIGENFLYENANYDAFAYDGEEFDHALFDIDHQITVSRLLPKLPSPNVL